MTTTSERRSYQASTSEEQRGLEDLWKHAFPFERTLGEPHLFSEYNWNFSHLQNAFKEDGLLHGEEKVFAFSSTQMELLYFCGRFELVYIPMVVVVVSPFPPSDKIVIVSLETHCEEIVDMENLNMGWVPYIPQGERASYLETPLPQISIISRAQREGAALELDLSSHHCVLYFNDPCKVDETEEKTVVDIVYSAEAGIISHKLDWRFETPMGLTYRLIDAGKLSKVEKDAFRGFVKEKIKERERANSEAIQKQKEALEELRRTDQKAAAFGQMRFYKYYPVATPDTPDFSRYKSSFINRYYGKAHQVF